MKSALSSRDDRVVTTAHYPSRLRSNDSMTLHVGSTPAAIRGASKEGLSGGQGLEAECLGDEDDGDAGGGFVVDDECLCEHRSGEAGVLHAGELAREAVLA